MHGKQDGHHDAIEKNGKVHVFWLEQQGDEHLPIFHCSEDIAAGKEYPANETQYADLHG